MIKWYFAFYPPALPFTEGGSFYSMCGHVKAFGYNKDNTWLFFDPRHDRSVIQIAHRPEEIKDLMAECLEDAEVVLRIPAPSTGLINPYRGPFTCVSQCAALMGWRAYTLRGFQRKLRANGAKVIHGT